MQPLYPEGRGVLIGSLPLDDHQEAFSLICEHSPDIPLWVQLPVNKEEGMMVQFLPGLPGLTPKGDDYFIDSEGESFDAELLDFYEDYMAVVEEKKDLNDSRFALRPDTAEGFFIFLDRIGNRSPAPFAVKGQITGPFTLATGIKDENERAVFYNDQVRDAVVKLLAQKARWQVMQLRRLGLPVVLFFDEPALAGFGSSAFISISPEDISNCFEETIAAVHSAGGFAGIHVCANTEWSLILDSSADIVSFDAYSYFDKFLLYPDQIRAFIDRGGMVAWGIIPTLRDEDIDGETTGSLVSKWTEQFEALANLGIDKKKLFSQTFITPSCGTGSLGIVHAKRVLELTRDVSKEIRRQLATP
jgi:methionine synthase II (cobalamin-independent)